MLLSEHKNAKEKNKSSKALQLQWHIQQIRAVQQCLDQTQKNPSKNAHRNLMMNSQSINMKTW